MGAGGALEDIEKEHQQDGDYDPERKILEVIQGP
jgi:hypothetical protein